MDIQADRSLGDIMRHRKRKADRENNSETDMGRL